MKIGFLKLGILILLGCPKISPEFSHTHLDFMALHLLEVVWDAVGDDDLVDVRLLDEARVRQQPVRRQSVDLVRAALLREKEGKNWQCFSLITVISNHTIAPADQSCIV